MLFFDLDNHCSSFVHENAFISFVAYVHGYLCDRSIPPNQALFGRLYTPIRLPIRLSQDAHNAILRSRKKRIRLHCSWR